jgi:hypothetical protein
MVHPPAPGRVFPLVEWLLVIGALLNLQRQAEGADPVSIHPENAKYFLFRGKPLVLIAAGEHYGSVVNRSFDFARYLADAADKKQTMTRTFLLYREQQTSRNPSSPIKPESPDYITPYPRTGPGKALDGEPIYDLDQWNPEFFERLHQFLSLASKRGIVVELTLFSNTYKPSVWGLNPLHAPNNKQGIGKVEWPEYTSLKEPALVARQKAYARKIIQETNRYDNVYYEICNEPGGGVKGHVTPAEVDAWQEEMGGVLRDELKKCGGKHLVFGTQAFTAPPKFAVPYDASYARPVWDAVNVHPFSDMIFDGRTYQLGKFMSKELKLSAERDFCLAVHKQAKPTVLDEDNCASIYRDEIDWTIHRKRAWMAVMCGAHYDYIDFSITVGREAGTRDSRRKIRTWMRNLSEFIHAFDFIHAKPLPDWITNKPDSLVAATLAVEGKDYITYLADAREVTDAAAGQAISGKISFVLPPGSFRVSLYSPTTGVYSPAIPLEGGKAVRLELLPFQHDLVIRATRSP